MSQVDKFSVSMPRDEAAWVRDEAERQGAPLSAVLTRFVREARERGTQAQRRREAFARFLDAHLDKPLTEAELAAAESELREYGLL